MSLAFILSTDYVSLPGKAASLPFARLFQHCHTIWYTQHEMSWRRQVVPKPLPFGMASLEVPIIEPLRSNPRFHSLLRRMNFPE